MANSDSSIVFVAIPSSAGKRPFVDLTGVVSERLTVLGFAGKRGHNNYWFCKCECDTVKAIAAFSITSKHTVSCGCLRRERNNATTHGHATGSPKNFSPEYKSYRCAQKRCNSRVDKSYSRYGGRGVLFLFASFAEFLSCVGLKPSKDCTLDRINADGHYESGNVRWASDHVQRHNKRNTIRVVWKSNVVALSEIIDSGSKEYQRICYGIKILGLDPTESMHRVLSTKAFQVFY